MARKAQKTAFDTVTSHLGQLTRSELQELADVVAALLSLDDDQVEEEKLDQAGDKSRRAARGHIEAKMINGCGPYLYLRYWSGKTLKSKYIGKKGSDQ